MKICIYPHSTGALEHTRELCRMGRKVFHIPDSNKFCTLWFISRWKVVDCRQLCKFTCNFFSCLSASLPSCSASFSISYSKITKTFCSSIKCVWCVCGGFGVEEFVNIFILVVGCHWAARSWSLLAMMRRRWMGRNWETSWSLNTQQIQKKIVKFLARAFLSFSTNCVLYSVDSRLDSIADQQLNTHQSLFFWVLYRRCRCLRRRRRRLFLELSFGTISLSVATSKSKAVEWVSNWKIFQLFLFDTVNGSSLCSHQPSSWAFFVFHWVLKLPGWRWWIFKKWKITTKTI